MMGFCSFSDCPFCVYISVAEMKRSEGKHHSAALSHAAKKFVRTIYTLENIRTKLRHSYNNGDFSLEEGAEVYIFTPEERIKSQVRLALTNQMQITFPAHTELSDPWFKQQNGHYCGSATVKQVLHYINGISQSQDDYAQELGTTSAGTDMTRIPEVLNSHISGYEYAYDDE